MDSPPRHRSRPFPAPLGAALWLAWSLSACGSGDLRSPDPERRAAAVSALSASRAERDWPALLAAQDDPSPLVRKAAAGALTARAGPRAVEALGKLVRDADPGVAVAAARGLAALPQERRAGPLLVEAWWQVPAEARPELAAALDAVGMSPRRAVEEEARRIWERNLRALGGGALPVRAGAAEELGASGRAEAVRLLLPLLDPVRGDPALAAGAARGLGRSADRSARRALEPLLASAPADLAEAAAGALGALGDPAAADALAALGRGGPARLAEAAVDALGALPPAGEVAVALCEVALKTAEPATAARAAQLARQRGGECPDRPLLPRLARRGADLRSALAVAGELRLPPERRAPLAERIAPLLSATGLDAESRADAAAALGRLGHPGSGPVVSRRAAELAARLGQLRAGPSPPPRPAGAPSPAAPPSGPGDEAGVVRELAAAVVAAARLRAPQADALARALAEDRAPPLRVAAAEALDLLAGEGRSLLPGLLGDRDRGVRQAAARGLGRCGAAGAAALGQAVAAVLAAPGGEAAWLEALALALGETGEAGAVPPLLRILEADGPAAAEAAQALGRLGAKESETGLVALLESLRGSGRIEAIDALAGMGGPEAGRAVARQLWSASPTVRAAAARALGRLRHEAASAWLEALRSDYSGEVRRAAVEALAKLPSAPPGRR